MAEKALFRDATNCNSLADEVHNVLPLPDWVEQDDITE